MANPSKQFYWISKSLGVPRQSLILSISYFAAPQKSFVMNTTTSFYRFIMKVCLHIFEGMQRISDD